MKRTPLLLFTLRKSSAHIHAVASPAVNCDVSDLFLNRIFLTEMAGHYKGGEVSAKDQASQQYRVQRLLPP